MLALNRAVFRVVMTKLINNAVSIAVLETFNQCQHKLVARAAQSGSLVTVSEMMSVRICKIIYWLLV